jgi:hypothetical protein
MAKFADCCRANGLLQCKLRDVLASLVRKPLSLEFRFWTNPPLRSSPDA